MEMKAWTFVLLAAPAFSQFLDFKREVMMILNSRLNVWSVPPGWKERRGGEEKRW